MTKTTVADDEMETASFARAKTLNTKPITFLCCHSDIAGRGGINGTSVKQNLFSSMSFPMLLGLNVAVFEQRERAVERKKNA